MQQFIIYFMTTSFVVHGGKVNTMFPINRLKKMGGND